MRPPLLGPVHFLFGPFLFCRTSQSFRIQRTSLNSSRHSPKSPTNLQTVSREPALFLHQPAMEDLHRYSSLSQQPFTGRLHLVFHAKVKIRPALIYPLLSYEAKLQHQVTGWESLLTSKEKTAGKRWWLQTFLDLQLLFWIHKMRSFCGS